jgi:hypothetical protein
LLVSDFANENHIGRLVHGIFHPQFDRQHIGPNFTLVDDGLFVLKQKFDWILKGQYVPRGVFIPVVNHGRQGGTFARPGGANHQHQAAFFHHQALQNRGQLALQQRWNDKGHKANDQSYGAALNERTDPKAP